MDDGDDNEAASGLMGRVVLWFVPMIVMVSMWCLERGASKKNPDKTAVAVGIIFYAGLLLFWYLPSLYLRHIRMLKGQDRPVTLHYWIFWLLCVPTAPVLFFTVIGIL